MTATTLSNEDLREFIAAARSRVMLALRGGDIERAETWAWLLAKAVAQLAAQGGELRDV